MSESGESRRKLTLDDLERFLSLPIEPEAGPTVTTENGGIPELTPYLDAASVLEAFDPFLLQPTPRTADREWRELVLDHLLPLCEQTVDGPLQGLWTLGFGERRAALRRLSTRDRMRSALDANPSRPDTPIQRVFERLVNQTHFDLNELSRDELAALITVVDWTAGILDHLPAKEAIQSALARADLLAPMERLAGHGFVNRKDELQRIEQYVFGPKHSGPLFVFGPGGVGKSTLLARFILQHVAPLDVPFAYIDIDRPTIRPDRPLTLLLDIVAQLRLQLELPADAADSLINAITFSIGREETTRTVESLGLSYDMSWYFSMLEDILRGSPRANHRVVIFLDTFEEVQFLGPDVVQVLLGFVFELNQFLPPFRIILSGRALPPDFVSLAFPYLGTMAGQGGLEHELALDHIIPSERPINLTVLEEEPARDLLRTMTSIAGLDALDKNDLDDVIGIVGRNPMSLKLAARLLRNEGIEKLRRTRSEFLTKLKAEKIQALLYGRILNHLHSEDVRRLAYPGLVVRRIAPDVIREVLAKPCGLTLTPERNEYVLYWELSKEAALVEVDPLDGSLRHRTDVRRAMLGDLTDYVDVAVVQQIDKAAVAFYAKQSGGVARAEEIYHRLRLGQPIEILNDCWFPEAAARLKGAGEELPARQRLWLANKLGVTLEETVRQTADQEAWEDQAARTANRFLESGAAEKALSILHERSDRLPRSQLHFLEAEAYRLLGKLDEAMRVSQAGVEALSKVGAIDMALALQLKMVNIAETWRNLQQAETLLVEAEAIADHTQNEALRLRVHITKLRLQRQLRPYARTERVALREHVIQQLTDEMLYRLRSQPVLLREVAAELGKDDPRIARTAIDTLGFEVTTDIQAQALGRAITILSTDLASRHASDPVLAEAAEDFQSSGFDPDLIRTWVTRNLTILDSRKVGQTLSTSPLRGDVQDAFRTYFRVGVDSMLRIPEK